MNMNPNENEPFLKTRVVKRAFGMLPMLHRKLLELT
jgi:hypothetical protein